ncbi:MAG: prolyl-tRNA synthetase associated domain-containing protein [Firmicutes bacterium]|nr:prolyl-tRNA synthetase associated domain-containing protein [Bacillota bacterium]
MGKNEAIGLLDKLGIEYEVIEHPPLFTCADGKLHGVDFGEMDIKNLFIRNKNKSRYYMVIIGSQKRADLKCIEKILGESRMSFGSPDDMMARLGVTPGAVSLMNLANVEKPDVTVVIDSCQLEHPRFACHPNVNTATVVFPMDGVYKILEHAGVEWRAEKL